MFQFFCSVLSLSLAVPAPDASPAAYASDYTNYIPVEEVPSSQYHAQDDHGQYNYGFASADQVKQEVKTADGVIRGGYSYVDANGITQSVNYIADALGFRVAASNLPVHNVEAPVAETAAPVVTPVVQPAMTPNVDFSYLPYAQAYDYQAASVVQAAPAPVAIPVVAAVAPAVDGSQYHAQDEFGQYSFGYKDPNSVRQEVKTADGVVRGAYQVR